MMTGICQLNMFLIILCKRWTKHVTIAGSVLQKYEIAMWCSTSSVFIVPYEKSDQIFKVNRITFDS